MKKIFALFIIVLNLYCTKAQVPVSKEPRHHVVFENEKVRLLNVLLPAGDTTKYHVHSTPSVFIGFTKTNTGSQLYGKEPVAGTSVAGTIWFENLSAPHTKIHRVWNNDTGTYHVMDIEILSKDTGFTSKQLTMPHIKTAVDTPWARTYKIELLKTEQVTINKHTSPFVLVAIDDGIVTMIKKGTAQNLSLQQGTFFWIKPSEEFTLLNQSNGVIHFALVQIK